MTRQERDDIRREAQAPRIRDSRHTYDWSPHGVRVHSLRGYSKGPGLFGEVVHHPEHDWEGFYTLRHCEVPGDPPTRLVLTGLVYGTPPAEIAVHFITLCEIIKYITGDQYGDRKYNLSPADKDGMAAAHDRARFLAN